MNSTPEGKMRDNALKRIEKLDCANPDKTLASCDPAAAPPPEVLAWQKKLLEANVDDAAFQKVLATELRRLVCANDTNAIYILRGTMKSDRLALTGREAPALVDYIMGKDCPVSTSLTDDDKAKLLKSSNSEKNPRLRQQRRKRSEPATGPSKPRLGGLCCIGNTDAQFAPPKSLDQSAKRNNRFTKRPVVPDSST